MGGAVLIEGGAEAHGAFDFDPFTGGRVIEGPPPIPDPVVRQEPFPRIDSGRNPSEAGGSGTPGSSRAGQNIANNARTFWDRTPTYARAGAIGAVGVGGAFALNNVGSGLGKGIEVLFGGNPGGEGGDNPAAKNPLASLTNPIVILGIGALILIFALKK